jgi:hypothetical protein
LRTRRSSDSDAKGTPAKLLHRRSPSDSLITPAGPAPPRGASPALSRSPSDSLIAPALPHLRRASDFGSPGVAVAGPFASRGASTMSARAQDDAMEMLLQVAMSLFNVVQFSRAQHFQLYPPPHLFRCRSWQARPLTLTLE